ncbi:hypothetical protein HMPREF9093_00263 [Fusobacterium sp. oral taxon 370 str. F0437]|uniref:DAK2 domain-containing protein n=1 Tax=Fusobacterium sp. oral taxon 370 TaxID=712288 RepID=UPI000234A7AD|nr:DAK2 domain-containing protein [Fusobacterium sp. oral taxon 370]EHI79469.1 hypothetical protein HMPREF9093_00263 [Fusobacterium sp. oral taxon 370 str. F0437]
METKIEKVLKILEEEIVAAEGCTEPIALSYAAAKARRILGTIPNKVDVFLSGNIIKNVKSVTIPNSEGMIGIEPAIAMGLIAGDDKKELMVISDTTHEQVKEVRNFLDKKIIKTYVHPGDIKLYIRLEISNDEDNVVLEIKHTHTNVTQILKNGKVLLSQVCNDDDFNSSLTDRKVLTVKFIYDLAKTIDIDLIKPIFQKVVNYNSAIAEEGLKGKYGVNIGKMIVDNIERGIYGNDVRNKAASYASAGSDARMSGCALPVMTTSGSGNQGMTASLPIIKFAAEKNLKDIKNEVIEVAKNSMEATKNIIATKGRASYLGERSVGHIDPGAMSSYLMIKTICENI